LFRFAGGTGIARQAKMLALEGARHRLRRRYAPAR
jgi:hypothetical protein